MATDSLSGQKTRSKVRTSAHSSHATHLGHVFAEVEVVHALRSSSVGAFLVLIDPFAEVDAEPMNLNLRITRK